jgi:hypothetical protein
MHARKLLVLFSLLPLACGDAGDNATGGFTDGTAEDATSTADNGDGDGDTGDGDPGDGDGDPGDGDGDPGDGDGDPGDGDGDGDPGDGDGDPGDGDGDTGDGDGDTGDGDGDGDPVCPLAQMLVPCDDADDDPLHAIGLGCPGAAPESIPLAAVTFTATAASFKVAAQFGSSGDWAAHEGEKLLIISTGTLPNPDNGAVVLGEGDGEVGTANANADNQNNLPNPIEPQDGSGGTPFENCDGQNDCSDTLQAQWQLGESRANDLLWARFDIQVPLEANGYEFDFALFTTEYPEWIDTMYNDIFVVWSTSETYTGNVTFINGQPLTVTALENNFIYEGDDPQLDGTGVDGVGGGGGMGMGMMEPVGGGTGWFTATASAAPEETFTIAWALFDMGDTFYDTTVVLDAFRWSCEGCVPSEVDGCGLTPQ